jgi:hypothetical protein
MSVSAAMASRYSGNILRVTRTLGLANGFLLENRRCRENGSSRDTSKLRQMVQWQAPNVKVVVGAAPPWPPRWSGRLRFRRREADLARDNRPPVSIRLDKKE